MTLFGRYTRFLLIVVMFAFAPLHEASAQGSLPPGWTAADIGWPAVGGSAESSGDLLTIRGGGYDIWETWDQFHFMYREISGDFDIAVRVFSVQDVDPWTKAGLMVRESLSGNSKHAFVLTTPWQGVAFQWRAQTAEFMEHIAGPSENAPVWLRLVRQGSEFRTYSSPDRSTWTLVGSATIDMQANVYVGLAVTSHQPEVVAAAYLSIPQIYSSTSSPGSSALPSPWTSGDIGSPARSGQSAESGGTFAVTGTGEDIWNSSDQFQFVYQPVTGDTEITALVTGLYGDHGWSKAGVMIRAGLTGPSVHGFMMVSAANGWAFQRRLVESGGSYHTAGPSGAAPGWVRLVRQGDVFSAYQSRDGRDWVLVGTDTIPMPATVYVGLAVTSTDPAASARATFTSVSVRTPSNTNMPPTVAITSPAHDTTYSAPGTFTINATAADVDGSIARVDVYQNAQLLGSGSTSSFTVTASNLAAGSYSLLAVATDDAGATATSLPITVTVGLSTAGPIAPTWVVFEPSQDDPQVAFYTVELRRDGDPVTASPVTAQHIGKPALVNGSMSADISSLVALLGPGAYYAVVVATAGGGSATSSPSAVFWM